MPLDVVVDVAAGFFRVVGRILVEVFIDVLVHGAGYLILRIVRPRHEPSDGACIVAGLVFWFVLIVAMIVGWRLLD